MTKIKFKNFTLISKEEKELVLKWRNSDRVRTKMVNQDIIPLESHLRFVDSLKNRSDCKYWLFMIDDIPVGVYDLVDIRPDGSGGVSGSYIGDEEYLGYGLLLIYIQLLGMEYCDKDYRCESFVMKNNPRTYKMQKKIFGAKDLREEEDRWYIYWDKEGWDSVKDNLKATIYDPLNIEEVIWEG